MGDVVRVFILFFFFTFHTFPLFVLSFPLSSFCFPFVFTKVLVRGGKKSKTESWFGVLLVALPPFPLGVYKFSYPV